MVLERPRCKRPLAADHLGGTAVDACAGWREGEERQPARSVERYRTDRGAGADTSRGWVDLARRVW
ncbi:MAG: hypothetical protein FJ090_16025 [Deltaproteobacteria bacterium]|nr:hypothetical protein [Deltaproteobacteria bacterium]